MRRRLTWSAVGAVLVALVVAFLCAVPLAQSQYQKEMRQRLTMALLFLSGDEEEILENPEKFARDAEQRFDSSELSLRFTFLDDRGVVLADSDPEAGKAGENYGVRPEIQAVVRGERYGYDTRTSQTTKIPCLYAATRLSPRLIARAAMPLEEARDTAMLLWACAGIGLLVGLLVAVVSAAFFSNWLARPIVELTAASRKIAQGEYDSRVGTDKFEIGALAGAFNAMAAKLQQAVSDLESSQGQLESVIHGMDDGVVAATRDGILLFANERAAELIEAVEMKKGILLGNDDVSKQLAGLLRQASETGESFQERLRMSEGEEKILSVYVTPLEGGNRTGSALAVLRDVTKMVRLEQLRSDFVANVTHELKTPLTSIRGFVELLRDSSRDQETRHYFYDVIDIEAERLNNLIDDLLALSEIENKRDDAKLQWCAVEEELKRTVDRCAPLSKKEKIEVSICAQPGIALYATPGRLQQMFENILVNAIKYNKPRGWVEIIAAEEDSAVVIRFRDTGVGIAREDIPRIFERFYRVDKSRSREVGGTGLGLSIVKHLVNLYGGEVTVNSTRGEGAEFVLRFPISEGNSTPTLS